MQGPLKSILAGAVSGITTYFFSLRALGYGTSVTKQLWSVSEHGLSWALTPELSRTAKRFRLERTVRGREPDELACYARYSPDYRGLEHA